MLDAHRVLAFLVVGVPALAALAGGLVYWRRRVAAPWPAHLLALAQTLLVAQVALGLLLVSDGLRAADQLHYLYGTLSLAVVLSPWIYAPPVPAKRLAWFSCAALVAGALAVRAYTTSG